MTLHRAALVVLLAGIFTAALIPIFNTDLWWHLHTGGMIVAQRSIPQADTLSFTAAGRPWLNHEWLAEVILFVVHRRFGLVGLLMAIAIVASATMYLLYRRMERRGALPVVALFLLVPAYMAMVGSVSLRIQPVTLLMLAVFLLILERNRQRNRSRDLALLPLLMLVWTNLHGGFAVGVAVIAIELAGALAENRGRFDDRARQLSFCLLATAAAAFVHPNGLRHVLYPFRFLWPNEFTRVINESQRTTPADPIGAVFIVLLGLLFVSAIVARRRMPWADLLLAVAFSALAFSQLRHISLWAVAITPILGEALTQAFRRVAPSDFTNRDLPLRLRPLNWLVLIAGVVAFASIAVRFVTPDYLKELERRTYPAAAMEALEARSGGRNLFAEYRWAGYAIWKLSPRYRLFIDGRADTVYDGAILRSYLTIRRAEKGWEELFDRHGVDTVLVPADAPLAQALRSDARWTIVYGDRRAVGFVRRRRG